MKALYFLHPLQSLSVMWFDFIYTTCLRTNLIFLENKTLNQTEVKKNTERVKYLEMYAMWLQCAEE